MRIIKGGDENAAKIINKKRIAPDKTYRMSIYAYPYAGNGRYLLRHTMTHEVVELTAQEWSAVMEIGNTSAGCEYITSNGLEELVCRRYIVESDHDEVKQYETAVFILKTMAKQKKGLRTYTIFPTTGCNARCVYCYEEGCAVKTMSENTVERLVDFICETRHDDMITLMWFGGEPIMGAGMIRRICSELKNRGVPFRSKMITNASLITREIAHEAKELWNLQRVQVSLDGGRDDYEKRKKYVSPEKYNYDVVMNAIHCLADEGIRVVLRCNFDGENAPRLPQFFRELKAEFGGMENISMYLSVLYQEENSSKCIELYRKMYEMYDEMERVGIPVSSGKKNGARMKLNTCMADSLDKSIVITPDGIFNSCEHLPAERTWGNIFDGVTDPNKFTELNKKPEIDEQCRVCPFLPECTPFYKKGCPNRFESCREVHEIRTEHYLKNLLKGTESSEYDENDEEI